MAVVYIATNAVNGKSYIGQSWRFENRKKYHLTSYSSCHAFHSAVKKYGQEAFSWEILLDGIETQDLLDLAEEHFIWYLRTVSPRGYNIRNGGFGGGTFSEESRKKLSDAKKGKKHSDETRAKRAEIMAKKWDDPDFRKVHLEGIRRAVKTPEWKAKNDIKSRWETRRKNNPNWKEDAKAVVMKVTATKEWREKNKKVILDRFSNPNWIRSIEENKCPVMCVETRVVYESQRKAALDVGCPAPCINRACKIPTRTAGGFHWVRV